MNLPLPNELERLAILVEECAEVQQIAMKIIRHGYGSHNPFDENKVPNRELLNKELGDLMFAVTLMEEYHDINTEAIFQHKVSKRISIQRYLHFNYAGIEPTENTEHAPQTLNRI